MTASTPPRVALLIPTATGFGREIFRGVASYVETHTDWTIHFHTTLGMEFPADLPGWGPDGVIALVYRSSTAEQIEHLGVPVVDVSQSALRPQFAQVHTDGPAVGRMAAEHFLERGFETFAYWGDGSLYCRLREKGFVERLAEAGKSVTRVGSGLAPAESRRRLMGLDRPLAVLGANDRMAREVVVMARLANLQVPQDIAVLGVDNDDMVCRLFNPPLSSVDIALDRRGFLSAKLLDEMMRGLARRPAEPILVQPKGVVTRKSTDVYAVADPRVAAAMQFIRDNVSRPIGVSDVVEAVCVSRRTLEMAFRNALGRMPAQEIRRARIRRAQRLLLETDLTIAEIAPLVGFPGRTGPKGFCEQFRREAGMPPSAFRSRQKI